MLELIRKYRTAFSIIFVLSAVGMVISMFGTPGGRGGGMGSMLDSGVAAKVDGEEISSQDLMSVYSQQMDQMEQMVSQQVGKNPGSNRAETRKLLEQIVRAQVTPDRILDQMIQERFRVAAANRAGIHASPETLRSMIESNPAFQKSGQFDPLLYRERVAQPGLYEHELAMEAKVRGLYSAFLSGLAVESPLEKEQSTLLQSRKSFQTFAVNPAQFPEPKSVSPAEVDAFLKKSAESQPLLQAYYDKNIRKYRTDEQVHARHILIKEDEGGLKKAQEVAAEIQAGKIDFAAAAQKYSADKSNASKGGDLGFFGRGVMDPAFEKAAFDLKKPGSRTEAPVKSSFGYHLIELVDRKLAEVKTLEQVKKEIATTVLLEKRRSERARAWVAETLKKEKVPTDAELKKMGFTTQWAKAEWSPLDETLGSGISIEGHRAELLNLSPDKKPLLPTALTQGESLVLVARVADKKDAKAPATPAPEATPDSKAERALTYFLRSRYEDLEKEKKIVRSDKVLSELRRATQSNTPDEG